MARYRFPGKALKLNGRKRVKFRNNDPNYDESTEEYVWKIVRGYGLFRNLFGYSEEEEEGNYDFEGFTDPGKQSDNIFHSLAKVGYVQLTSQQSSSGTGQKHDNITGTAKRKVGRPLKNINNAAATETKPVQKEKKISHYFPVTLTEDQQKEENISVDSGDNVCSRSSRVIKPSRKLLEYNNDDDDEDQSGDGISDDDINTEQVLSVVPSSPPIKRPVGRPRRKDISQLGYPSSHIPSPELEVPGDRVSRNISLYADTISSHTSQVGRPPKRGVLDGSEDINASAVQEKIKKLLQSPWDARLKQAAASNLKPPSVSASSSVAVSRNILRKARLHLNKRTLQKIRNPVSVQHLLQRPASDSNTVSSCGVCQVRSKCEHQFGITCCQHCFCFLNTLSEKLSKEEFTCSRGYGGCQLVGISIDERCNACWLSRALLSCTLPSLMHDRLRKKLPQYLKERVPTSLARSVYVTDATTASSDNRSGYYSYGGINTVTGTSERQAGSFGSIVDLPGGWKRITGPDLLVISPSGEKFKSVPKLEEYLFKLGITIDAQILFGGARAPTCAAVSKHSDETEECRDKSKKKKKKKKKKRKHKEHSRSKDYDLKHPGNNCVVTTLPGGWVRRTQLRRSSSRNRFDVIVSSPCGRTFRSKKQLFAYFQQIGKVDDIIKYFPLFHERGEQMATSSEKTESSTEPGSSSEFWSEADFNEKGVLSSGTSDDETYCQPPANDMRKPFAHPDMLAISANLNNNKLNISFASEDASHDDFIGFEVDLVNVQSNSSVNYDSVSRGDKSDTNNISSVVNYLNSSTCDTNSKESVEAAPKTKRNSVSIHLPILSVMNADVRTEMDKLDASINEENKLEESNPVKTTERKAVLENNQTTDSPPKEQNSNIGNSVEAAVVATESSNQNIPVNVTAMSEEPPLTKTPVPVFKAFQTQHLGGGWSRKIKWNRDGIGRVSFVITPSGSRIQSTLELQGYLKKEGTPITDTSIYFPQQLKREDVPEKVTPTARIGKTKGTHGNNNRKSDKKGAQQDAAKTATDTRVDVDVVGDDDERGTGLDSRGPRIKRVCRSLEQALGMPRATFPGREGIQQKNGAETDDSDDTTSNEGSHAAAGPSVAQDPDAADRQKPKVKRKQAKVFSVMTTASGTVLRKTQWCNRCSGCLIPNCRKCQNCTDMVKYGGPGTKKKPCVKRRCINPRLSIISSNKPTKNNSRPSSPSFTPAGAAVTIASSSKPVLSSNGNDRKMPKITRRQVKKMEEMQKRAELDVQVASTATEQKKLNNRRSESDAGMARTKEQEKVVFIPRQMTRPVQEVKERSDAAGGKTLIPGGLVNIDYWQGYDADQVLEQGFPVLQAAPLHLNHLCFRCGSAGKEEMLWCSYCCEGIHPYCLEEGEGPENSREEECWVCRRCAVCHVCGAGAGTGVTRVGQESSAAGTEDPSLLMLMLHRCSACLYYYHLECLGPGAHETCTPPNDALWRCVGCSRCSSCSAASITTWIHIPRSQVRLPPTPAKLSDMPTNIDINEATSINDISNVPVSRTSSSAAIVPAVEFGVDSSPKSNLQMSECSVSLPFLNSNDLTHKTLDSLLATSTTTCCTAIDVIHARKSGDKLAEKAASEDESEDEDEDRYVGLCSRCVQLRSKENYCPLCQCCYEDDDYDARMMECGRCKEWVHAQCEGLSNEHYQILSCLPDSVEYVCRLCRGNNTDAGYLGSIMAELKVGMEIVLDHLISSRCSKHLVKRDPYMWSLPAATAGGGTAKRAGGFSSAAGRRPASAASNATSRSKKSGSIMTRSRVTSSLSTTASVDEKREKTSSIDNKADNVLSEYSKENLLPTDDQKEKVTDGKDNSLPQNIIRNCKVSINVHERSFPSVSVSSSKLVENDKSKHVCDNSSKICGDNDPNLEFDGIDKNPTRISLTNLQCTVILEDCAGEISKKSHINQIPNQSAFATTDSTSTCTQPASRRTLRSKREVQSCLGTAEKASESANNNLDSVSVTSQIAKNIDTGSDSESGMEDIQANIEKIVDSLKDPTDKITNIATKKNDSSNISSVLIKKNLDAISSFSGTSSRAHKKISCIGKDENRADPKTKISKDIDDDLVSTEESSFCDTDSELESIIEDPDEPKDFLTIKEHLGEHKYDSVLQFHVDVCRVIEAGKYLSRGQTKNILVSYTKFMKECFPWFDVQGVNIFDLIDKYHPFPLSHSDHNYAITEPPSRLSSSPETKNLRAKRLSSLSPNKTQLTMVPHKVEPLVPSGKRKCLLCNCIGDGDAEVVGRLLYLGQDEWLHVNCGLWSSEVYEEEDGGLQKVYEATSRGRMIKCNECSERGATVGCCHRNCSATYHFRCAMNVACQFLEDKRMFCSLHKNTVDNIDEMEEFSVNRCVFVDMGSQKKKWKKVLGNKANITIGSLTIHSLGRILPELDSTEALIPVDFVCSRLYWSTIDPRKRVRYICRTKRIFPVECKDLSADRDNNHFVIDHSKDAVSVEKDTQLMKDWFRRLEEQKVAQLSRKTNIIPPHMCPLYREIMIREGRLNVSVVRQQSIHSSKDVSTAHASSSEDDCVQTAKKCIEDILDKVCKYVEEESLFLDTELPGIVSSVDNELISMVLNDLDGCDPGMLQSVPNSGPTSPIDLDFLSNFTKENENEVHEDNTTEIMHSHAESYQQQDVAVNPIKGTTNHVLQTADHCYQSSTVPKTVLDISSQTVNSVVEQVSATQNTLDGNSSNTELLTQRSELPLINNITESYPGTSQQDVNEFNNSCNHDKSNRLVNLHNCDLPLTNLQVNTYSERSPICLQSQNEVYSASTSSFNENNLKDNGGNVSTSATSTCEITANATVELSAQNSITCVSDSQSIQKCNDSISNSKLDASATVVSENAQQLNNKQVEYVSSTVNAFYKSTDRSFENNVKETISDQADGHNRFSAVYDKQKLLLNDISVCEDKRANNVLSGASSTVLSGASSINIFNKSIRCNNNKKQVCRVLPMVSSRRSSATSDAGSAETSQANATNFAASAGEVPQTAVAAPPPLNSVALGAPAVSNHIQFFPKRKQSKKICMKRNYKTVIKKYPLRSSMKKNKKPYQTVQIEINETIVIPEESEEDESRELVCKSVKRKWNTVVESEEDEEDEEIEEEEENILEEQTVSNRRNTRHPISSRQIRTRSGLTKTTYRSQTNSSSVSKQVVKFSDDNNDITVSIVNNNNMCTFSTKSRGVHKYRHKTLLQVDGAVDFSSGSEGSESDEVHGTNSDMYQSPNQGLADNASLNIPSVSNHQFRNNVSGVHLVKFDSSFNMSSAIYVEAPSTGSSAIPAGITAAVSTETVIAATGASTSVNSSGHKSSALQSALAMRIKEQSLAHSAPGDEGPYKCSKCRRLYRTCESYERHIETCTFEIDSSSTSDEELDQHTPPDALQSEHQIRISTGGEDVANGTLSELSLAPEQSYASQSHITNFSNTSVITTGTSSVVNIPAINSTQMEGIVVYSYHNNEGLNNTQNNRACSASTSVSPTKEITSQSSSVEPASKKIKLELPSNRLSGVHRQVRTAIKKSDGAENQISLPPLTTVVTVAQASNEVFVPPSVSPHKFSGILKKSGNQRRYTNVRLVKGSKGYQFRKATPSLVTTAGAVQFQVCRVATNFRPPMQMPVVQQAADSGNIANNPQQHLQQHHVTTIHTQQGAQPIQISIPAYAAPPNTPNAQSVNVMNLTGNLRNDDTIGFATGQFINVATSTAASGGQILRTSYPNFQVPASVSAAAMPMSVVQGASGLTAIPSGYTVQYVGSYAEPQHTSGIVAGYQQTPVVLQQSVLQPQLMQQIAAHQVLQQSSIVQQQQTIVQHQAQPQSLVPRFSQPQVVPAGSVVVPQVVNTNITYAINAPKTLVLNQPLMQTVQLVHQQQHQDVTDNSIQPNYQCTNVLSASDLVRQQEQQLLEQKVPQQLIRPSLQIPQQLSRSGGSIDRTNLPSSYSFNVGNNNAVSNIPIRQQHIATEPMKTVVAVSTQDRPQASVLPISSPKRVFGTVSSVFNSGNNTEQHLHQRSNRLPFNCSSGIVRNVATVAPAIITSTLPVTVSLSSDSRGASTASVVDIDMNSREMMEFDDDDDDFDKSDGAERPRPTYSYRDAMNRPIIHKKKLKQDAQSNEQEQMHKLKEVNNKQGVSEESSLDNSKDVLQPVIIDEDKLVSQSYKLVLKRDSAAQCGFNVLPIEGTNLELVDHEVKELRIKAKISLGPKRKKINLPNKENELLFAPKDTTHDGLVNEQIANMAPQTQSPVNLSDEPNLFDKAKSNTGGGSSSAEPYIVFELTSEDGFKVESRHMSEVWQTVFDAVTAARANLKMPQDRRTDYRAAAMGGGNSMSQLHMLGLTHNAVQYLLEQLPGSNDCQKYSFQFHRRYREEGSADGSLSGCVRTESFKSRSPYDLFSWLASQHRQLPETDVMTPQEEIQLSTRRATSLELPMAMRYRHLRDTAREAVGVFRSSIHGRGLFCKRDIDFGEMVIEYAGQMIRSSLCDIREKFYEGKGIGCYMFRIDDDTVVDATMHGNAARFINHSCDPNCYSRVVDILGKKHIIIFALRRIIRGEELTYDYKFPIEDDKIPCSCGARRCRKTLN